MFTIGFRLHSWKLAVKRLGIASKKQNVPVRKFKKVSETKLNAMTKTQLKKRTEAKMMWWVRAYNDWHKVKLSDPDMFDVCILRSDLNDLKNINKSDFEYSMCRFIVEVVKIKGEADYPGSTLYQFCVTIQKFLVSNGLNWKLIKGDFVKLHRFLQSLLTQWKRGPKIT